MSFYDFMSKCGVKWVYNCEDRSGFWRKENTTWKTEKNHLAERYKLKYNISSRPVDNMTSKYLNSYGWEWIIMIDEQTRWKNRSRASRKKFKRRNKHMMHDCHAKSTERSFRQAKHTRFHANWHVWAKNAQQVRQHGGGKVSAWNCAKSAENWISRTNKAKSSKLSQKFN